MLQPLVCQRDALLWLLWLWLLLQEQLQSVHWQRLHDE